MTTRPNYREKYDTLYNDVKQFYLTTSSGRFTLGTLAPLTRYAMEIVQTGKGWSTMKGSEKKRLVTEVIQEVVTDLVNDKDVVKDMDENTRQAILLGLETVPFIIDAACDFAKVVKKQVSEITDDVAKSGCFCK